MFGVSHCSVFHAGDSGILTLFFLVCLVTHEEVVTQASLSQEVFHYLPRSSTVVYLEVHPNHVVRIESLELEAASD